MRTTLTAALALAALIFGPARAEEDKSSAVDTEHIFGFTEGTDIGDKGEREFEVATTGLVGKPGSFIALGTESTFRYGVEQGFRASLGVVNDYHGVYNSPDLDDRKFFGLAGLTTEFRWTLLEREKAPFGLVLSFAPEWRLRDATAGAPSDIYNLPVGLLLDKALVDKTVYVAANFYYSPSFLHSAGAWSTQKPLEASFAGAYRILAAVFVGAELRQYFQDARGLLREPGLFVGPSFYLRLSEATNFKIGWSSQIPHEGSNHLDLVNYERHQFIVQFATGF